MLLVIVLAFNLVACGSSAPTTSSEAESAAPEATESTAEAGEEATEAPAEGAAIADQVVIALSAAPTNLDPVTLAGNEAIWMTDLLYGTLMRATDDGSGNEPYMADSYTVSDDGLTYTFKLKEGMLFSDGTPVTGEDWVWSILRARDTEDSLWTSSAESIVDVTAPDDTTVVITLAEPRSSFIAEMGMFNLGVQCKAYVERIGEDT